MLSTTQRSGIRKRPVRALVVQDDVLLGETLRDVLQEWGARVHWVRSLHEAISASVEPYDVLVLDVSLADGSGVKLAELAVSSRPTPLMLAVGSRQGGARDAFRLAQLGAAGFLQTPVSRAEIRAALEQLEQPPDYLPHLVAAVGRVGFREIIERARCVMAQQALAMSGGNKTGAARLLGITRQAVQQLIRDLDLREVGQRGSGLQVVSELDRAVDPAPLDSASGAT